MLAHWRDKLQDGAPIGMLALAGLLTMAWCLSLVWMAYFLITA